MKRLTEATVTNTSTIYAETTADIQPDIDGLASKRDDNGARGGMLQLSEKIDYPKMRIC